MSEEHREVLATEGASESSRRDAPKETSLDGDEDVEVGGDGLKSGVSWIGQRMTARVEGVVWDQRQQC